MQLWLKAGDQQGGQVQAQESPFLNRNRIQKPTRAGPAFSSELLGDLGVLGPFYEAVFSQILELSPEGENFDSRPATPTPVLC